MVSKMEVTGIHGLASETNTDRDSGAYSLQSGYTSPQESPRPQHDLHLAVSVTETTYETIALPELPR